VQEGIATGVLKPGDRLRAVRQLADELEIAPGTVAKAYAELERLGVVVTAGARGTRIAERGDAGGPAENADTIVGLLRPVAVAAFHMGANAHELRAALEQAMKGIFETPPNP
jgi:DNA-binding transcriptional regulator YhcF (GntR family)